MTQASPVSTQSSVGDPLERRESTVGRVQSHLEVKIVGSQGRGVPSGQTGGFCARSYSIMHGYWGDEDKAPEAIDAGGWMHTGDLATIDEKDQLNIVNRLKDMVIRGGEHV